MELRKIRDTEYMVSKDGRVFSPKGKQLSTWIENNTGYTLVRVRRDKKPLCLRVHVIVAECWIPNPNGYRYVKHKNDDKTINDASNLEWGTNSENTKEGYENGCYKFKRRSYKVTVIHKETGQEQTFKSVRSLSETLGLHRKNVSAILDGRKTNTYEYEFRYEMPND